MKVDDLTVWTAFIEPTKPLCVSGNDWSITIFVDENKRVTGVMKHKFFKNGSCKLVSAKGVIPAEYYEYEEKVRI